MPLLKQLTLPGITALKRLAWLAIALLLIGAVLVGQQTFNRFEAADQNWETYNQRATAIGDALYGLQQSIGYGGVIHNFKNHVLRGNNPENQARLALQFQSVEAHLDLLDSLFKEKEDKEATQQLRHTFSQYHQNFLLVETLHQQNNFTSVEIDQLVKVSDQSALNALLRLGERAKQRTLQARQAADQSRKDAKTFFLSVGLLFLVAILIASIVLFWIINNLIQAFKDLSETKARLERAASTDFLTGLHNRREFIRLAQPLIEQSERSGAPIALAMLDIDYFKKINDQFGHDAGDEVLVAISNLIKNSLRKTDIIARWGGEEFCILAYNTDDEGAKHLFDTLLKQIEKHTLYHNKIAIRLTVSIGVTCHLAADLDVMVTKADQQLYKAKNNGRNQIVFA